MNEQIADGGDIEFHRASTITSFDGKISGIGIPGNITLNCNKTGGPVEKEANSSVEIAVPNPWTIECTNLTIKNIVQDSIMIIMEDAYPSFEEIKNSEYAMQFNVTNRAVLTNFSIYVYEIHKPTFFTVSIYNATLQGSRPEPHVLLKSEDLLASLNDSLDFQWHNFTFSSSIELNPSSTYANAFFITITNTVGPGGKFQWGYELDSVGLDSGAAYFYNGSNWVLQIWDFSLKVGLTNISRSPSNIDLRINGTIVNDKNENEGEWISTSSYSDLDGFVSYNITANITVSFLVEWLISYRMSANQSVNTYFEGFSTNDVIYWNASYTSSFISGSFDNQLDFSLPAWNSVINIWSNQTIHGSWSQSIIGQYRKITVQNAGNADWVVQCNDTNYVDNVTVKRAGIPVSVINSTDTIEIFANFTEFLTNGDANLTVYPSSTNYSDTDGELITYNETIRFSPTWRMIDTATGSYTQARLQVYWFNGTAAGIRTNILAVNNIPTNLTYKSHTPLVDSGDSIFIYVNYSNNYTGQPLIGASLLVKNSTDDTTWPAPFQIKRDFGNGTYEVEVLTLGVPGGLHFLSVNLSKPLYLSSEYSGISVSIGGGISNVSVTAPNCVGLDYINQSYALANPAPYHNASVKVTIYYYSNFTLEPLTSGVIAASWIGGGSAISWVPAFFGYYNITIDVTGFHADTNHTLKVTIQESGYDAAVLYIIVPIRKLPTEIIPLETSYSCYLEETITVYAVFEDSYNDESIPTVYSLNGNFTIQVGNLFDTMALLAPTLGLYYYDLVLSTVGLAEGMTYNITFSAFSSEHEFATVNISLEIRQKAEVELFLLGIPDYVLAGTNFKVYANLTLKNGPPFIDVPVTFKVRLEDPGSTETPHTQLTNGSGIAELLVTANPAFRNLTVIVDYSGNVTVENNSVTSKVIPIITLNCSLFLNPLPAEVLEDETIEISATLLINGTPTEGEIVTFEISYDGGGVAVVKTGITDASGTATISLRVPGVGTISVTADYVGPTYVIGDSSTLDVSVVSKMQQFWRLLPYFLAPIGAVIGAIIAYKYGYKRRKLQKLQAKWQKSMINFQDISNLDYLMILIRKSGMSIYNYSFKAEELDYQLMSGFLSAISAFKGELGIKEKKGLIETGEWEIVYQDFKIFGINRELVQFVLILEGSISESLKNELLKFIMDVERNYNQEFIKFKGNVAVFNPISTLVEQYFDRSITLPHISVDLSAAQLKQLPDIERKLYNLGAHMTDDQGYFYVSNLMKNAQDMLGEDVRHIIDSIYNLVAKRYFTSSRVSILLE